MPEFPNPSSQLVDARRRRFIKQSLISGGVVAAMSASPLLASQATAEGCGLPSKSEWLVIGLTFVTQVSTDAYERITNIVVAELTTYKGAFDELYCLLNALSVELAKSPTTATAAINQMNTLAQVGRANTGFVNAAFQQGDPAPLFLTLALVSQEICAQAQNIPPAEKEWTLTKEASGILKKILELVSSEKFTNLHKGVVTTQNTSNAERKAVNESLSKLHLAITAARVAILLAENPNPRNEQGNKIEVDKAEQWKLADDKLVEAINELKNIVDKKFVSSLLPEPFLTDLPKSALSKEKVSSAVEQAVDAASTSFLPATDSLILGLGTCRREIAPELNAAAAGNQEFRFVRASYAAPPPIDRNAMANLLWAYCPPGSREQIDRVDSIISFVGGWSFWLPQSARERLIGSGLYWANRFNRITCSGTRDLRTLAAGLAGLV